MICKNDNCNRIVTPNEVKRGYKTCIPCRQAVSSYDPSIARKKLRNKRRMIVLEHYGNKCAICGTNEDLHIDHIDGNGKLHRLEVKKNTGIEQWLIENNFPNGFQLLCRKHNLMKTNMSMQEFLTECSIVANLFKS